MAQTCSQQIASVVCALLAGVVLTSGATPIKTVVVLMQENRAFDHFLGHLNRHLPEVDGLGGHNANPSNVSDPNSKVVPVNENPYDTGPDDPCHSFQCISEQVYGFVKPTNDTSAPVKMDGFVQNALGLNHSTRNCMSSFNASTLPVLYNLTQEFAVFDKWFCSSPTPTNPNREFLMSSTSGGVIDNAIPKGGFTQQTHFDWLGAHNVTWRIYYSDNPWGVLFFKNLRQKKYSSFIRPIEEFFPDAAAGRLPQYTFIEPRMAASKSGPSTWQHPDASVSAGEELYRTIYTTLRSSPHWNELLYVITYDEHGGFYDHVPPPQHGVPSPDGKVAPNGFTFERLGIRVPTVAISPWIPKGTVVHTPPAGQAPVSTSQYDATSIIATMNRVFGITGHMTARDAWAGTFTHLWADTVHPRSDCPTTLPKPHSDASTLTLEEERAQRINSHQAQMVDILCELNGRGASCGADVNTQGQASDFLITEWAHYRRTSWGESVHIM